MLNTCYVKATIQAMTGICFITVYFADGRVPWLCRTRFSKYHHPTHFHRKATRRGPALSNGLVTRYTFLIFSMFVGSGKHFPSCVPSEYLPFWIPKKTELWRQIDMKPASSYFAHGSRLAIYSPNEPRIIHRTDRT